MLATGPIAFRLCVMDVWRANPREGAIDDAIVVVAGVADACLNGKVDCPKSVLAEFEKLATRCHLLMIPLTGPGIAAILARNKLNIALASFRGVLNRLEGAIELLSAARKADDVQGVPFLLSNSSSSCTLLTKLKMLSGVK